MGIPVTLLRTLTLQTQTTTTDAYGATVPSAWSSSPITGRVDQQSRSEDQFRGRDASVSQWLLLTNTATVAASDRIVDGSSTYEVEGPPWPVYAGSAVHHYEATLRVVTG